MKREMTLVLVVVMMLLGVGILTVYSVSAVQPGGMRIFRTHLAAVLIGLAGMYLTAHLDYHFFRNQKIFHLVAVITLALLVYVLLFGSEIRGARRWIHLLTFQFQPSELAKFTVVVFLAIKLAENQEHIHTFWRGFLPPLLIACTFAGLIVLEPDLGVPAVIVMTAYIMMFVAGVRLRYLLASAAPVLAGGAGLIAMYPHRVARIVAFIDPFRYRETIGFHLIQSLAAYARGAIWGVGPGAGQQKLFYLPDAHTDFIFAAYAEEMGLVGTLSVLTMFFVLMMVSVHIARCARDLFGSLLATGIISLITLQALFNMAVTMGLVPTKGLPLPFVSYGGTASMVFLTMVGILLNIGKQAEEPHGHLMPAYSR